MDTIVFGGMVRMIQGLAAASPTFLIGLFIASLLRFYLGPMGTYKLFGGQSVRSLPQSWLLGMLLPVCSIGVIPILRELKRVGVRPGAITAFALSAPLFNPLSLLYGLTLSRPIVICGFAIASLVVVTTLGLMWDRLVGGPQTQVQANENNPIGIRRVLACLVFSGREVFGPSGALAIVALSGLLLLGMTLPHGALQTSAEQTDPLAPARMAFVATPIYATPMLTMSQLGMMFAHGNSPGAAFALLLLGTGVNLATLLWIVLNYGMKASGIWFGTLFAIVITCAYAIDGLLIQAGVEPAGHTHAFDIYTNPYIVGARPSLQQMQDSIAKTTGIAEYIGLSLLGAMILAGIGIRTFRPKEIERFLETRGSRLVVNRKLDRIVSAQIVGATCIVGLIALSIVACYAYYPSPKETLEEMRLANTETIYGANLGNVDHALHWLPLWEEWSRKLEVGYAIRHFELSPYQQAEAQLLRKKLELLEHELDHEDLDKDEIRAIIQGLHQTSRRLHAAFSIAKGASPN